jgi:lantibiotic modifying enzyme
MIITKIQLVKDHLEYGNIPSDDMLIRMDELVQVIKNNLIKPELNILERTLLNKDIASNSQCCDELSILDIVLGLKEYLNSGNSSSKLMSNISKLRERIKQYLVLETMKGEF